MGAYRDLIMDSHGTTTAFYLPMNGGEIETSSLDVKVSPAKVMPIDEGTHWRFNKSSRHSVELKPFYTFPSYLGSGRPSQNISLWVRVRSVGTHETIYWADTAYTGTDPSIWVNGVTKEISFMHRGSVSAPQLWDGEWHHIFWVGPRWRGYLDGVNVLQTSTTSNYGANSGYSYLGGTTGTYDGDMLGFGYFGNTAANATEADALAQEVYSAGLAELFPPSETYSIWENGAETPLTFEGAYLDGDVVPGTIDLVAK